MGAGRSILRNPPRLTTDISNPGLSVRTSTETSFEKVEEITIPSDDDQLELIPRVPSIKLISSSGEGIIVNPLETNIPSYDSGNESTTLPRQNRNSNLSTSVNDFFRRIVTPNPSDVDDATSPLSYSAPEDSRLNYSVQTPKTPDVKATLEVPSPVTRQDQNLQSNTNVPTESDRPEIPVACECNSDQHSATVVLEQLYYLDIRKLFLGVFGEGGSDPVREANKKKETIDIKFSPWNIDSLGKWTSRDLLYEVWFKPPMMAKSSSPAFEKQTILKYDELCYVVETSVTTPKVPFGDTFTIVTRYCFTHEGKEKSRLVMRVRVDFTKKFMLKGAVESASIDGVGTYGKELTVELRKLETSSPKPDVSPTSYEPVDKPARPTKYSPKEPVSLLSNNQVIAELVPGAPAWVQVAVTAFIALTIALPWHIIKAILHAIGLASPQPLQRVKHKSLRRNQHNNNGGNVYLAISVVVLLIVSVGVVTTFVNLSWMSDIENRLDKALWKIKELQRQVPTKNNVEYTAENSDQKLLYTRFLTESQRRIASLKNSVGGLDRQMQGLDGQVGELKWEISEVILDLASALYAERQLVSDSQSSDLPAEQPKVGSFEGDPTGNK
ncbi:Protein Aster-A [Nowakowskiella sp. JEL0078]|nr:Protein Aster-A [Nowakowskiella sp. JEL0078]